MKRKERTGVGLTTLGGLTPMPSRCDSIGVGCATYCIVWWPKPAEPTLLIPDVALTCWLYCGTLRPVWGGVAVLSGLLLVLEWPCSVFQNML